MRRRGRHEAQDGEREAREGKGRQSREDSKGREREETGESKDGTLYFADTSSDIL